MTTDGDEEAIGSRGGGNRLRRNVNGKESEMATAGILMAYGAEMSRRPAPACARDNHAK